MMEKERREELEKFVVSWFAGLVQTQGGYLPSVRRYNDVFIVAYDGYKGPGLSLFSYATLDKLVPSGEIAIDDEWAKIDFIGDIISRAEV